VVAQIASYGAVTCTANSLSNAVIVRAESASAPVSDIEVACSGGTEVNGGPAAMQMAQISITANVPFAPRVVESYASTFSYTVTDSLALATTTNAYPAANAAATRNCFTAKDLVAGTSGLNICTQSQTIAVANAVYSTNAYDGALTRHNVFHARLDPTNANRLLVIVPLAQVTGVTTKFKLVNLRVAPPAGGLDAGSNVTFVAAVSTGIVQDLSSQALPNRLLYIPSADLVTTTANPLLGVSAVSSVGYVTAAASPTVCEPNTLGVTAGAVNIYENSSFLNGFMGLATDDDGTFVPTAAATDFTTALIGVVGKGVGVKQRFAVTFTNVPTGVSVALPRYAEVTKVAGAAAPIAAGTSYANKIYARLLVTSYLTAGGADDPTQLPANRFVDLSGYASAAAYIAGVAPLSVPTTTVLSSTDAVRSVTAYYELEVGGTALSNNDRDYIQIAPRITYSAAIDTAIQATAAIGLAPTGTTGPRFNGAATTSGNWLKASECACTLMFPYVTDKSGYDTGLAMANTSRRVTTVLPGATLPSGVAPFNNAAESSGPVTARFFPAGVGAVTTAVSTKALKAGDMLTYVISQGNAEYGLPAVPDFVGYVALTGSFNYCHGFGYISAAGAGPTTNGMSVSIAPLVMNATRTSPESLGN